MAKRSSSSFGSAGPMTLSQTPGRPSFRSNAVNAVAVIPLLSSDKNGQDDPTTYSSKSFEDLLQALSRYNKPEEGGGSPIRSEELLLVVPNSNLTRPGEWRYDNTPLKNFHWSHGCQRLTVFDGRPYHSRMAHDRLMNHGLTRDWIDLWPHRRTAALIGVLNVRDCPDMATLKRAEQEWQQWAERYSTPPYEVTAHGRDFERDFVVQRLFVFDSSHEANQIDLAETSLGSSLVAFPPADNEHTHMMDLHMNVVINDLAVAIFQELEGRIRESDAITQGELGQPLTPSAAKSRFFTIAPSAADKDKESGPQASSNLSLNTIASVVSAENKLSSNTPPKKSSSIVSKVNNMTGTVKGSSSEAQLLTPLDDVWDYAELNPKDAQAMLRREVGRREKFAGDLSLLAGSPMDAYERYSKAAELCKTTTPDPLWYASALEGCAAAHIAMAEAGGFNVDQYLENSFQLPDEMMACAIISSADKNRQSSANKQTMSRVVVALCDEALDIYSRHPKLSAFRAELLLKLAWYCAEVEDAHIRCLWGMGEGCYGGDGESQRWEKASATQMNFLELKTRDGDDIIAKNNLKRCQGWTEFMHRAVSCGGLDPVTRADVGLRCASMCITGLRPTARPPSMQRVTTRYQLRRKASFFALAAAEAMSEVESDTPDDRTSALWMHASQLFSRIANSVGGGNYAWATLRACVLHARALQGIRESSEEAAVELLSLIGEIQPSKKGNETAIFFSKQESREIDEDDTMMDSSTRSDPMSLSDNNSYIAAESVVSAARSYVRTRAQDARARGVGFFTATNAPSSLLTVAQSKWVNDDPIKPTLLPLADVSKISNSVLAMSCVWSKMRFDVCVAAQKKLIGQISGLRKDLATSSFSPSSRPGLTNIPPPIRIASARIVPSESHANLERVKVKDVGDSEKQGAMATFFNPYAAKKKKGDVEITLVAAGEERYVLVEFVNYLSVPLEIPRCQLEFNTKHTESIKAPAMSFVIPGQTSSFAVQFPFIILNDELASLPEQQPEASVDIKQKSPSHIEVTGFHVTCLGRTFFLPIEASTDSMDSSVTAPNMPKPSHLYPRREYGVSKGSCDLVKPPRLEVVPAQPNLLVSFATSPTPIEESTVVPAPLADGEVFKVPSFRLTNDSGPNGQGKIEELRITAVGLPQQSETVLLDMKPTQGSTDTEKGALNKVDGVPPLTLVASCLGIDYQTLNEKTGTSTISLQLSATHDLGAHTKGCTLKIRFRYRGSSSSPGFQMWRTRVVQLRVIRVKGPRISSLTFRPDLSWESAYAELCRSLARQNNGRKHNLHVEAPDLPESGSTDDEEFVLNRIGMDSGVHICNERVVVLVSIANETNAGITLSKPKSLVGGFNNHPIETIRVSPGVSTKIPMLIQRLDRGPGICEQLMAATSLHWESEVAGEPVDKSDTPLQTAGTMVPVNIRARRGYMKIPSGCLKSIIDENPTFLSRICKAPCRIEVRIDGQEEDKKKIGLFLAKPVDLVLSIEMADWVPAAVLSKSRISVEFCCAPRGGDTTLAANDKNHEYAWVGQIRKQFPKGDFAANQSHRARLIFLRPGNFIVSACVNINNSDNADDATKEIWWAKEALSIHAKDAPVNQ